MTSHLLQPLIEQSEGGKEVNGQELAGHDKWAPYKLCPPNLQTLASSTTVSISLYIFLSIRNFIEKEKWTINKDTINY